MLSEAPSKGALAMSFVIGLLLFPNVLLHTLPLQAHGRHYIPTRPEVFAHDIPVLLLDSPSEGQRALAFQEATHRRYRSIVLSKPPRENCTPGTLKALRVSLVNQWLTS